MDENVHFYQHTSQLISHLIRLGKPYQLQVEHRASWNMVNYNVFHLVCYLGWVDLDLDVPPIEILSKRA